MVLRDYQIDIANKAAAILRDRGIVYLALQTRTGKTLTALETCRLLGAINVLFISKLKALPSIQSDYDMGGFPFTLQLINYDSLHKIQIPPETVVVCDEAHSLAKFPKMSLRTKRVRAKAWDKPVIFLSGTPTPESYSQIFNQLAVSARSPYAAYKNFYQWARDYVTIKQVKRGAYMVNDYSDANEERIKANIEPIMISFTQEQAGFKCEVEEHFIPIHDEQIPLLIRRMFKERVIQFPNGFCVAETPAALLNKMHQISGGTAICDNGTQIISEEKAKYIRDNYANKRIAVYYKFIGERTVLDKYFPDATTSAETFQAGGARVFLSQIQSGREGLALCSADVLVFYNIDYSSTSYWQSRARIQDLNRSDKAVIHWLCTVGGLEKNVYKAVSEKRDFTLSYYVKNKLYA